MHLSHLVYFSRRASQDPFDVRQILETSQENNATDNITGALFFDDRYFFQILEGPRSAVSARYAVILRDQRHTDVVLTLFEELEYRMFPDWRMAEISHKNKGIKKIYASYLEGASTPDRLSGAVMWQMIEEMSRLALRSKVERI